MGVIQMLRRKPLPLRSGSIRSWRGDRKPSPQEEFGKLSRQQQIEAAITAWCNHARTRNSPDVLRRAGEVELARSIMEDTLRSTTFGRDDAGERIVLRARSAKGMHDLRWAMGVLFPKVAKADSAAVAPRAGDPWWTFVRDHHLRTE